MPPRVGILLPLEEEGIYKGLARKIKNLIDISCNGPKTGIIKVWISYYYYWTSKILTSNIQPFSSRKVGL